MSAQGTLYLLFRVGILPMTNRTWDSLVSMGFFLLLTNLLFIGLPLRELFGEFVLFGQFGDLFLQLRNKFIL